MSKSRFRSIGWGIALLDALALNAAFALAGWWRFDDLRAENPVYYDYYVQLLAFLNLSWLALLGIRRHHRLGQQLQMGPLVGTFFQSVGFQLLMLAVFVVVLKGYYYSRLFLGAYFLGFAVLGMLLRLALAFQLKMNFRRGKWTHRVLLAGKGAVADALSRRLEADETYAMKVVHKMNHPGAMPTPRPDEVLIATEGKREETRAWVKWAEGEGLRWRLVTDGGLPWIGPAQVDWLEGVLMVKPRREPLEFWPNRFLKRTGDVLVSILVVVLVFPWFLPLVWLIQQVQSPGPLLFRQERSGLVGKPFKVFKIRTMKVDNPRPEAQATRGDARVFGLGRLLRRTGLDELPQVINVLQGHMSWVGPRPHLVEHTQAFKEEVDAFMIRHLVKPGITGLAQVQGHRGELKDSSDLEGRVQADV